VGHGTVLLALDGLRLLTDPVLGRRAGLLRRLVPPAHRSTAERIDAILLSHLHADHADLPSLRRVGSAVPIVAPSGAAPWLVRHGFSQVRELRVGEATSVGEVTVAATPARHGGGRWPHGHDVEAVGLLVEGSRSVYYAGDTDLFPEMASLAGRVDLALLPVSGWGPTLGPGHLDPARAAEAASIIRPRVAIPVHWGTLGLPWKRPSREALAEPARDFAAAVRELAPGVDVRLLDPGERVTLA
jgi:L-ascorbate metabolism protein UlaG (beta-lactamase superfamily)